MNPILDRIVAAIGLVGGTAGLASAWLTGESALIWPSVVTLLMTALVLAYSHKAREAELPSWGTRRRRISCYTVTVLVSGAIAAWLAYAHEWRFDSACTPLMAFLVLWLGFIALGYTSRLLHEVRGNVDV